MTTSRQIELLRASLFALNWISNTRLNHPEFKNTDALACAIGDYLDGVPQQVDAPQKDSSNAV